MKKGDRAIVYKYLPTVYYGGFEIGEFVEVLNDECTWVSDYNGRRDAGTDTKENMLEYIRPITKLDKALK